MRGKQRVSSRPSIRAAIVRRKGKRVVRVTIGKSTVSRVKVKIVLRDRRRHAVAHRTRALRAGKTTFLTTPRVTSSVRSVRATYVSLVR